jgi:type I restriction enzyme M protein
MNDDDEVVFLNPRTCGIYKNGAIRFKTDRETGLRTKEIDNELIKAVEEYNKGQLSACENRVKTNLVFGKKVLVPTYYDTRYNAYIHKIIFENHLEMITIGELIENRILKVRGGHGSPGNDQRTGNVPYVKVSDIRALRINVNPTNLIPMSLARRYWRGESSALEAWDLITPNRASSNIGEFAILLPGEEQIVLTKEVFIFRIIDASIWDPFYLLWALSLKAVREQWRRIALMQTNREDCGDRYKEIILPKPLNYDWANAVSKPFRDYFTKISDAKNDFISSVMTDRFEYVANVTSSISDTVIVEEEANQ